MSTTPVHWIVWDLPVAWELLTLPAKLFVLFLMASAVYVSYLLLRTISELRALFKSRQPVPGLAVRRLTELSWRLENLSHFNTVLLVAFGAFFANESFNTIRAIQLSVMSLSPARFDVFLPLIEFAFFVLAILAILQGFQWIVAVRLRAAQALLWFNESTSNP